MIKQISWEDIRDQVKKCHPAFAKLIDSLSPTKEHYLYLVTYPYGSMILDHGVFQIPIEKNGILPISHSAVPNKIRTDLNYSGTIPLGFVIERSIEAFMNSKDRTIPSSVVKPGQFISLWRVLDKDLSYHSGRFWNITSGARTVCMIPKITDTSSHKILKNKFGINSGPQRLSEHWEQFTEIYSHPNFNKHWESTILFFPKKWMEHQNDIKWKEFYHFLLETVWESSNFRRNQFIFDFAFSLAQEYRNLRPNPYLADTVRHLIAIGSGAVPGFAPAIDDSCAPIGRLQEIYIEDYNLKKYAPVIVHSHHFSPDSGRPVYYSFQIPTTTIFSPKSRKLSSAMEEIHEVKHIMETLLSEILKGNLEVENTPLFELAKNVRYDYFHADKDKLDEISLAGKIAQIDKNFEKTIINNEKYSFPEFAPFFRGCISISKAT